MQMRINWKKLRSNIPNKVRTAPRSFYEIFWSDAFHFDKENERTYGITRFDPQQIILDSNQPDKEAVHTMYHEFIHALSAEYEIGLTEAQVRGMENTLVAMREFILALEKKK